MLKVRKSQSRLDHKLTVSSLRLKMARGSSCKVHDAWWRWVPVAHCNTIVTSWKADDTPTETRYAESRKWPWTYIVDVLEERRTKSQETHSSSIMLHLAFPHSWSGVPHMYIFLLTFTIQIPHPPSTTTTLPHIKKLTQPTSSHLLTTSYHTPRISHTSTSCRYIWLGFNE